MSGAQKNRLSFPLAGWLEKGFSVLLEAFYLLKQAGYAFSGVIYGDGPLRGLDAWIKQSGLEEQVTWLVPETRRSLTDLQKFYTFRANSHHQF
jgi:glycosyltransferase involved in cell wall biosynthesis